MTGNNKVWRAPLAGLASVAMLATMGVAAGTANAADAAYEPTVTYKALNDAKFSDGRTTYTATINDHTLDAVDLTANAPENTTFTGWYTEDGQWVKPGTKITEDTTLVAHWDTNPYTVNFDLNGVGSFKYNGNGVNASTVTLATTDKLQDGQIPVDNQKADGYLLDSTWQALASDGTVKGEVKDVKGDLADYTDAQGSTTVDLKAKKVDAYTVNFHTEASFSGDKLDGTSVAFTDKDVKKQAQADAYGDSNDVNNLAVDVAVGSGVASLPQVRFEDGKTINDWALKAASGKKGDAWTTASGTDKAQGAKVEVYPVLDAAVDSVAVNLDYANDLSSDPQKNQTVYVAKDGKLSSVLPAPKNTTFENSGVKYEFAGWSTVSGVQFNEKGELTNPIKGDSAPVAGTTYYAQWKAVSIALKFNPNYGQEKTVQKWFAAGDSFQVESFSRDGYTLGADWSDPASLNEAKLINKKLVIGYNAAASTPGWRLYTTDPKDGVTTAGGFYANYEFTAVWTKDGYDGLTEALGVVEQKYLHKDEDLSKRYLNADEQSTFTADSFNAYVEFAKSFYTKYYTFDKDGDGEVAGDEVTVDQAKELASELNAANAKLVFVGNVTVYRLASKTYGRHLLTTSEKEASWQGSHGFAPEGNGVAFKTVDVTNAKGEFGDGVTALLVKIARLYNAAQDRQHYAPAYGNEYDVLTTQQGWTDESAANDKQGEWDTANGAWYAPKYSGSTKVWRLYIPSQNEHLWTTGQREYDAYAKPGSYAVQEDSNFSL